jgi:rhodanese-related sulfurtransferase
MTSNFYFITGLLSLGYTIFAGAKYYSLTGLGLITSEKAKEMIKNKTIDKIIDVRTNFEHNLGNLNGSINIPVNQINQENLNKFNINKNDNILVYCNTGQRARYAVEKLRDLGYNNISYIEGSHLTLL